MTAYVRQHARRLPEQSPPPPDIATTEVPPLVPDIAAIMTVLRRRTRSFDHGEPEPLTLLQTCLTGATLYGAYLTGADLKEADLTEANLREVDLSEAKLIQEQLEATKGDETTFLPPNVKPPAYWSVKTDEQIEEH